jgi:hypothetical protein
MSVAKNRDFIDYSMFDVDGLEVSHRFINSSQTSLKNALISKIITLTNKFRNNGFFSFKVFSLYQHKKFHLQTDYFSIMLAKESILNTRSNNYNLNIELFHNKKI